MNVTAIIAAYNEEETLGAVLEPLANSSLINEVIVVSDGSTDRTVEVARLYGARTIALHQNRGKGYAMRLGVEHAAGDVLFFVDADMTNLTNAHIEALVLPVVDHQCDMNVGVRNRGPIANFLHLNVHFLPVLSGIRVMTRNVFWSVPAQYMERYKIELALNYFSKRSGFQQMNTVISGLGHIIKEKKWGWGEGFHCRWAMNREVFLLHWDLYLFQTWRWSSPLERGSGDYELFEAELVD